MLSVSNKPLILSVVVPEIYIFCQSSPKKSFIILFPGSVVDVGKLMKQLTKSEKAKADLELQLADTNKNLAEVKEVSNKHASSKEKLMVKIKKNTFRRSRFLHV